MTLILARRQLRIIAGAFRCWMLLLYGHLLVAYMLVYLSWDFILASGYLRRGHLQSGRRFARYVVQESQHTGDHQTIRYNYASCFGFRQSPLLS